MTNWLTCISWLVYESRLLFCLGLPFPFCAIRAPTSKKGYSRKLLAKFNIEPVNVLPSTCSFASRDWEGLREEMRGSWHLGPWQ